MEEEESDGQALPRVGIQDILAQSLGKENTWGSISGRLKPSPMTACGVVTDDNNGKIKAYVAEGDLVDQRLLPLADMAQSVFPRFQKLLNYICMNGFEHHAAINPSNVAKPITEAFRRYKGWDIYTHNDE